MDNKTNRFQFQSILTLCIILFAMGASSQTTLEGTVTEDANGIPVPFATVALMDNGKLLAGGDTDFDGNYFFSDLDPGIYDLEISFIGFATKRIENIIVHGGKVNMVNASMIEETMICGGWSGCVRHFPALIAFDEFTSGTTIYSHDIRMKQFRSSK